MPKWNNCFFKTLFPEVNPIHKKLHTCEEGGAHTPQNFLLAFTWKTWKIRILKWKKIAGYIIILHKCKTLTIWDTVPKIQSETEFIVILGLFCPFTPAIAQKLKMSKKWRHLEISFHKSIPKIMIIGYIVLDIWRVMDVISFHSGQYFALLPPNSPKSENFKKMKRTPEDIII